MSRALGVVLASALLSGSCAVAACGGMTGCGAAAPARSSEPRTKSPSHVDAPDTKPRPAWEHWSRVQRWPTATRDAAVSRGHFPGRGLLLDVRVDPDSQEAYSHWVRDSRLKPGAVVVALLRDPKTRAQLVAYAMEKHSDGTWDFLVLSSKGRVESSADGSCAGCHADALADFIFGPSSP